MTYAALSSCEEKGKLQQTDLPQYFRDTCPRLSAFADMVSQVYDGYRRDRLWDGRLQECRELAGEQMQEVAEIMRTLSGQMEPDCIFLEGAEENLRKALQKQGFHPRQILAAEEGEKNGRQVKITVPACGGKGACREKIQIGRAHV